MQLIASLATVAAVATSANALGNAVINNNCDFNVYMWPVDAQRSPSSPVVIAPKGSYSEPYHTPTTGGVSLKLSKTNQASKITQFEYTVQSYLANPYVWYDGSNVDCTDSDCPFYMNGINLKTSDSSCPTRDCPVGKVCTGFYTLWNDDVNSLSCSDTANVIMTLCSVNTALDGSSSSGSSAASSSSASSVANANLQQAKVAAPVSSAPAATVKTAIMNEAVATTFVTAHAAPSKRAEPVRHGHMHYHQRRVEAQES